VPHILLDDFAAPAAWLPRDPLDAPSAAIVPGAAAQTHPFATDPAALSLDILPGAAGHVARRALGPIDLTGVPSLTLWVHSDTALTGTAADLFRPRVALGSAALPIGAPGNDWVRYLPCERARSWSYAILALDDLDPLARGALDTIEIQIAATDGSHNLLFDGLEASAPQMIADLDAALLAVLDGQLVLGGGSVPAVVEATPPPANQPAIRLIQYEATRNERRAHTGLRRTDFTDSGHRLRPSPIPWDVFYRVEFIAATRTDRVAMEDFVIGLLGHRRWLPVGNRALRIEQVDPVTPDDALIDVTYLRYRVSAWSERGAPIAVEPVSTVEIETDILAGAGG